jgi:uncharacterized protein YbjT (DUF2867 family)
MCREQGINIVTLPVGIDGWRLGRSIDVGLLKGVSHAVHLAYDFRAPSQELANLRQTVQLVNDLRDAGLVFQCFVSSLSAGPHSISEYGRTKFAIEEAISSHDVLVIRPGLVIGNGGIWSRIETFIRKFHVAILPGGHRALSPAIDAKDLCRVLLENCLRREPGLIYVFEDFRTTFYKIIRNRLADTWYLPLPIPTSFLALGLGLLGKLGFTTPVRKDNLEGFSSNQHLKSLKWERVRESTWISCPKDLNL